MKSSNPFLKNASNTNMYSMADNASFTVKGAINKSILSFVIMIAMIVIIQSIPGLFNIVATLYFPILIISMIGMIVMYIQVAKDSSKAKSLFFFYTITEGLLLTTIIGIANAYVPGVGLVAGVVTLGFVFFMLLLYRVAPGFIGQIAPFVYGAIFVVAILMMFSLFFSLFGAGFNIYDNMGFIVFLIILSAFSVATDFRNIDMMENQALPKEYEYIGALGLVTSVVWLYINVLRFLLMRNND